MNPATPPNPRLRIGIVDDHTLFRRSLASMLEDADDSAAGGHAALEVVLSAENGNDCLAKLEVTRPLPDMLLMDVEMPEKDGIETMRIVKSRYPGVYVIMLTVHNSDQLILNALKHGANGYLLKTVEQEELIAAIEEVSKLGVYINPRSWEAVVTSLKQNDFRVEPPRPAVQLSELEHNTLCLICEENTTQQIADKLYKSPRTVDSYRHSLLEKTGAKNGAGLVVYAISHGIWSPKTGCSPWRQES